MPGGSASPNAAANNVCMAAGESTGGAGDTCPFRWVIIAYSPKSENGILVSACHSMGVSQRSWVYGYVSTVEPVASEANLPSETYDGTFVRDGEVREARDQGYEGDGHCGKNHRFSLSKGARSSVCDQCMLRSNPPTSACPLPHPIDTDPTNTAQNIWR